MQAQTLQRKVLRTICPDAKGLIAKITNICYKHELNIVQNNEFVDHRTLPVAAASLFWSQKRRTAWVTC